VYILHNAHWFILLIGALVFFHELGHFLVAKLFKVKVQRFSLGFGPKIVGFVYGETEYWLSALPLGGYVKMLGETPDAQVPAEEASRALNAKPIWQRALVMFAGPGFNFLFAFVVYAGMFTGMNTFGDTRLGVVTQGEPAWNAGLRPGDKVLSVDGKSTQQWEDLRAAIADHPGKPLNITYERAGVSKQTQIVPQPWSQKNAFGEAENQGKVGISLAYVKPLVAVVDKESPAAKAGFMTGDEIVAVNSNPVAAWHELRDALRAFPQGTAVQLTLKRAAQTLSFTLMPRTEFPKGLREDIFSSADLAWGYTGLVSKDSIVAQVEAGTPAAKSDIQIGDRLLKLTVRKSDKVTEKTIGVWAVDLSELQGLDAESQIDVTLQRGNDVLTKTLQLMRRDEQDELKNNHTTYIFGATNDIEASAPYVYERRVGIGEAMLVAAGQVAEDATLIGRGLSKLVRRTLPLDSMGGPIMLFVIAEKSAKKGAQVFLRTMAVMSVNLGIFNLLPVPVLDGGHLLFCAVEAIGRRKPSLRVREIANMIGMGLLLLLMVLAFKNDILRYVLG
jgi:regulator of sigma E protease